MQNTKILLLMPEIYWGGAERQFRFLIENANAHNTDIILLNMHLHGSHKTEEDIQFVRNNRVDYYEVETKFIPDTLIGRLVYSLKINGMIAAILKKQKVDAAIVYEPQGCYSIPFLKRKHIRTIYSERNSGEGVVDGRRLKTLVEKADAIVCNSSAAKTVLENGLNRQVIQINNGIMIDVRESPSVKNVSHRTMILVPARIAPIKNQLLVIEMLHTMSSRSLSQYKVIFAGKTDAPEYAALLKEKVKEYKLEKFCEFVGFINDMESLYAQADIVILPSFAEGMSNVVLECFARKKMIVCSNIPMNCVNHGMKRFYFNPKDPRDLRDKIELVQRMTQKERETYTKNNYDYVCREYSIDGMVESYIRIAK